MGFVGLQMKQEDVTRKCIVSGKVLEKKHLLRFVATPEGVVVPDFKKRLPGKGVYVSVSRKNLHKAIDANLFAKALKHKIKPVDGLEDMVEQILRHQALQAISLARKAGDLLMGMDKVSEALKKGKVAFLLEATDAGADGAEKILRLAGDLKIYRLFATEELDTALNKINTVHVAFLKGDMSGKVSNEFEKFAYFLNS